jgi:uncharacterized membrane protein YfcA
LAGSLQYLRARLIDWRNVAIFGIPGMAGTYLGALSAAYVAGIVQLSLFAVVMLLASYMMLRPMELAETSHTPRESWKIATDGLLVGVITGLVGVGGGFLIVPALALLGGLSMHRAVATSLVIIALKSYSGFYKYLDVLDKQDLELDWQALMLITGGLGFCPLRPGDLDSEYEKTIATIFCVGANHNHRPGCRFGARHKDDHQ